MLFGQQEKADHDDGCGARLRGSRDQRSLTLNMLKRSLEGDLKEHKQGFLDDIRRSPHPRADT
jgi:hypothetical protein